MAKHATTTNIVKLPTRHKGKSFTAALSPGLDAANVATMPARSRGFERDDVIQALLVALVASMPNKSRSWATASLQRRMAAATTRKDREATAYAIKVLWGGAQ